LQARTSLNKVDEILNKPAFKEDLGSIIGQAKQAVDHVDLAARQLNQILNKRFPLVKMMIGRPGHIEKEPGKIPPVGEKKQGAGSINQK
ncbi:MAG: hypothetical protein K8F91_13540, partial [Candidatus Obscuribacterales bacterium]|nr:hypothetical protein [Candidatus Obscuribacterales bacterium]